MLARPQFWAPAASQRHWLRARLQAWGRDHLRDFPWRRTRDPYALLVAEFLLQKTQAPTVVPYYRAMLARYPTLAALAAASETSVTELLAPLGLRGRARRLHQAAGQLLRDPSYGSRVPRQEAQLRQLPGVGPYVARAVLTNAFEQPVAVLDANVARLLERFFGIRGHRIKSRDRYLWELAERLTPAANTRVWNLTLIDFGALVCTPQKPRCDCCPLRRCCHYARQQAALPQPSDGASRKRA